MAIGARDDESASKDITAANNWTRSACLETDGLLASNISGCNSARVAAEIALSRIPLSRSTQTVRTPQFGLEGAGRQNYSPCLGYRSVEIPQKPGLADSRFSGQQHQFRPRARSAVVAAISSRAEHSLSRPTRSVLHPAVVCTEVARDVSTVCGKLGGLNDASAVRVRRPALLQARLPDLTAMIILA